MQIQQNTGTILEFADHSLNISVPKESGQDYFNKHWQVIQTSIKFFILQKAAVNIVAFKKSLELLVLHNNGPKIRESLKTLWRQIFGQILQFIQKNESNLLISVIQHYKTIEQRLKIVFTLLKSYLDNTSTDKTDGINEFGNLVIHQRPSAEHDAFNILCKLILKSQQRQLYEREMILLIDAFRNSSYSNQSIVSEQTCKDQVRVDLLILKKIGLFRHLEQEFDQTSKDFYVQLSQEIPKNQNFLLIVNGYLQRQVDLNKIFEPTQNTVYYVEKQLIREYYDFVLDQLLEKMIFKKDINALKIFWKFTLKLKDTALKAFGDKLKKLIHAAKRYFVKTASKEDVFKLVEYQQNLYKLAQECFEKDRKIANLIYNSFEQVLYQEEKHYLNLALKNILQESTDLGIESKMILEGDGENNASQNNFSTSKYFKLFRLTPSKENFIKELQVRFSKWILNKGFQLKTLQLQEKMIQQMKKEVGNNLMKQLDKMFNDVYRNDSMHYQHQTMRSGTVMKCMFLSSNWPVHLSVVFNIPDELYNMQGDFEEQFKKEIENKEKSVKWVSEMGTVLMAIHGVQSLLSEVQASIVMILDKSIRPLKKEQLEASLNIRNISQHAQNFSPQTYLSDILNNLVKNNILTFNKGPDTYDINDDNTTPYKFQRITDDTQTNAIKRVDVERDNSILIEAAIMKILKKRKNMQRNDITRFIEETIKNFKPTFEQITKSLQKLHNSQDIEINREKGIISFVQ